MEQQELQGTQEVRHDMYCESQYVQEAHTWSSCGCADRVARTRMRLMELARAIADATPKDPESDARDLVDEIMSMLPGMQGSGCSLHLCGGIADDPCRAAARSGGKLHDGIPGLSELMDASEAVGQYQALVEWRKSLQNAENSLDFMRERISREQDRRQPKPCIHGSADPCVPGCKCACTRCEIARLLARPGRKH